MKLLNYNELKTLILEERDKIPLTVPGARYELYIPQPNKHGESMRAGIRIALRCMERCQPILLDDLLPKERAMWIPYYNGGIDRREYRCSKCWNGTPNNQDPRCLNCGSEMLRGL
jgi:hypothetical protein